MQSGLPRPDKTRCAVCGTNESPTQSLQRCSKCRTTPYCSVSCQKADWKSHKQLCLTYMTDNSLNYTGTSLGEKGSKAKKGEVKRTRGDIYSDLRQYALSHNGDTLTISAWNLMGLVKDISRAKTHFMAVTLRRTSSHNPRTFYTLVDYEIIPFSWIEEAWSNRVSTVDESPYSPKALLERDAAERKKDGALGSVMVISLELPPGDDRSPREALKNISVHIMQPLGLFNVHKDKSALFAALPIPGHVACLKNSLKGGAYSMRYVPYHP